MGCQVSRAQPHQLTQIWPRLRPQILRGLKKGVGDTLTEDGLFFGVSSGELHLWLMHNGDEILAGLFLKIANRERGKALVVLDVVAGDSGRYPHQFNDDMLAMLREYGAMIGAYTIESYSRLGAARVLMRHGCKPKAMIMELS